MYAYYVYDMPRGNLSVTIATNNIPTLKSAKSAAKGVEVSWDVLGWANCYNVYRKDPGGSWTNIAKGISGNKYIYTTAVSGKTYYYTVRGLKENKSTYVGDYNRTGIKVKYIAAPKLTKVAKVSTGVKVTFEAVSGASQYRIYRKEGSGSWKSIGTTTGTSYTDKTVVTGKKYTYTVRCISADEKTYESYYNTTGLSISYN